MARTARWWWGALGAAVVAAGVGGYLRWKPGPTSEPPPVAEADPVPIRVTPEGWELTHDCTLVLEPPAVVRTSPSGKLIFTPGVALVPTNRAGPTHRLRPTAGTEVRLVYVRIPLKLSRTVPVRHEEVMLTENNEPGVPVTTLPIRAGVAILPDQPAEVVDRAGTVVLRYPG